MSNILVILGQNKPSGNLTVERIRIDDHSAPVRRGNPESAKVTSARLAGRAGFRDLTCQGKGYRLEAGSALEAPFEGELRRSGNLAKGRQFHLGAAAPVRTRFPWISVTRADETFVTRRAHARMRFDPQRLNAAGAFQPHKTSFELPPTGVPDSMGYS